MATRQVLADLATELGLRHGIELRFESGGGVDIARRVRDRAEADLVVLAREAMAALDADGLLVAGTLRPLFVSQVVAAVAAPSARPLETESDLRALLEDSERIAYSTGPSGVALVQLVERWGLTAELGGRLLQAPPGVPVGSLVARGDAALGFQQLSELRDVAGITVLGPLPGEAAISSTFAGGVLAASTRRIGAAEALDLLGSPEVAPTVRAGGLTPSS